MDWRKLGRAVKSMGFDGVDLTVRPGGHVLPERAGEDLPRAAEAIRAEGVAIPMITTALLSAAEPAAVPILSTAGKLGITLAKPGYYKYEFKDIRRELGAAGAQLVGLVELARQHVVQIGYHNHAGYLGAPLWDIATIIEPLDPRWAGYYYDIRHAVVEGGGTGWKISSRLTAPRLKMIAVKDFYWDKVEGKGWQQRNCPLGQGMVDWQGFFSIVAESGFHGPISLHIEYAIPGSTAVEREENTLLAAQRDLNFLRERLQEAYR
jgi:sugar phosphate isomerase/epimerase